MKLMPKTTKNPHPVKTGKILDERMCRGLSEPKYSIFSRPCRKPCAFQWKVSDYGKVSDEDVRFPGLLYSIDLLTPQCDAGCGSGIASRQVICTNGTSTSEVDCDPKKKPKRHTVCQSKEHCVWKVKKFKSVSKRDSSTSILLLTTFPYSPVSVQVRWVPKGSHRVL